MSHRSRARYLEHINHVRSWYISGQDIPDPSQHRGDESEKRFESIVSSMILLGNTPWLQSISRATSHEDILNGFDFRLRVCAMYSGGRKAEFSILIDVKSSTQFLERPLGTPNDHGVYTIVMFRNSSEGQIRRVLKTIYFKEKARH